MPLQCRNQFWPSLEESAGKLCLECGVLLQCRNQFWPSLEEVVGKLCYSVHAYLDGGAVDPGDDDEGLGAAEGGVLVVVGTGTHALVRVGHHLVQQEPRDVQQHHQHDDHADLHLNTAKLAD